MRRFFVLAGTILLLGSMSGCGGDQRDFYIGRIVAILEETRAVFDEVKTELKKTVDDRKKDGKSITDANIRDVIGKLEARDQTGGVVNRLKSLGERLQFVKERLEVLREQTTDEQRKRFADNYKSKLPPALESLDDAQRQLDTVLKEADELIARDPNEDGRHRAEREIEKLRTTLKEGREPFELLTKQR